MFVSLWIVCGENEIVIEIEWVRGWENGCKSRKIHRRHERHLWGHSKDTQELWWETSKCAWIALRWLLVCLQNPHEQNWERVEIFAEQNQGARCQTYLGCANYKAWRIVKMVQKRVLESS